MNIYLVICCPENNSQNYHITRILRCIPTTLEKLRDTHDDYMREYLNHQGVHTMLISRNEDLSFLTKEAEKNA